MRDAINSLSVGSGALVIAVLSALLALVWARIPAVVVKWLVSLGAPLFLSYGLYWSPVFLGAEPSEFHAWAPLFVVPWFVAGAFASVLVVALLRRKPTPKTEAHG
jgi:hypothetical protein